MYLKALDVDKPFQRELLLKILKGFDNKRANNNLILLEEKVANSINEDLFAFG